MIITENDVKVLETDGEWYRADIENSAHWLEILTPDDHAELKTALLHAKSKSSDMLEITRDDFPLDKLGVRLKAIENDIINGCGFALIRGLDRLNYDSDDMCLQQGKSGGLSTVANAMQKRRVLPLWLKKQCKC